MQLVKGMTKVEGNIQVQKTANQSCKQIKTRVVLFVFKMSSEACCYSMLTVTDI